MSATGGNTKLYAILATVIIIAAGSVATIVLLQTPRPSESVLDLEGSDGTTHTLTMTDLLSFTPVEVEGSYQNSYNNTKGSGTYIGAKISDILSLVGGMDTNEIIVVNASDGYAQTFTYANVNPSASEYAIQGDMVLAYSFNGTQIPEFEDGPRIMFLPEDGYFSNADATEVIDPEFFSGAAGPKLVSNVAEITIMERPTPEPDILTTQRGDSALGFTMSEIQDMPSVTGTGGYKRSSGTIVGPFTYTGVEMEYILNQTGALPADYTIEVVASDGYTTYYNKSQVDGLFDAYDQSGNPIGVQQFTLVLAYDEGGDSLPEGGPLRVVTLSEDGYLSDGHFWAKAVDNITLIDEVEPWELELDGVQSWNMAHDDYYSLASCPHHRTEVTFDGTVYAGVPLWTIVSSFDGGEDVHYTYNVSLAVTGYNVSLFDESGAFVNFTSAQLAGNASIIVAGWANGSLMEGDDWPIKLVTPEGNMLGNIVRIEMWGFD
jgi:DMSO/TMAO reductase YedYZ molybdopterin-dependent catalytic subunit